MKVFRHSPRSFIRALEAGVFGDKKVEMLGGLPHVMTTNPPHNHAVEQLARLLRAAFPEAHWKVAEERFIRLGSWVPQPDLTVIRWPATQYFPRLAGPVDIRLIAEVSDTTVKLDRGRKLIKYASVGIPEYWIVDLKARLVRVFTDPEGFGKAARYRTAFVFDATMTIPPPVDAVDEIAVADILPPAGTAP